MPPAFFREQLAISGISRVSSSPKIRSLVLIDNPPLARLLRAAEPPNHTDWVIKSGNFQRSYIKAGGNHVVTYVKTVVGDLIRAVRMGEDKPDPTVAIDFFHLPDPSPKRRRPGDRPQDGPQGDRSPEPTDDMPDIEASPVAFDKVDDGFRLHRGDPTKPLPRELVIEIAYDVPTGNAFAKHDAMQFDLRGEDGPAVDVILTPGVEKRVLAANRVLLVFETDDPEVYFSGFDTHRDVIFRPYQPAQEEASPDEAAPH